MPVPILKVHEAKSGTKKDNTRNCQEVGEDLALFVTPFRSKPKSIACARQVVLKAMYKKPVLASTQLAGLMDLVPRENMAKMKHT